MPQFPDDGHRLTVVGKTGSGKTWAGLWHLSKRSYTQMPWYVLDWKGDEGIEAIPFKENATLSSRITDKPGIYHVKPMPGDERLEEFFWNLWHHENVGLYVDEAGQIPQFSKAYKAILTQGRSKHVPVIQLTQRPSYLSPWFFSESDFFQIFRLRQLKDREKMASMIDDEFDVITPKLPDFHSHYYDDIRTSMHLVRPVPHIKLIHQTIRERLTRRPKLL